MEEDTALVLKEVTTTKSTMGRVLSAWDSYSDCLSSLQAWLQQDSVTQSHGRRSEVILTQEIACCLMSSRQPTLFLSLGFSLQTSLIIVLFALSTKIQRKKSE